MKKAIFLCLLFFALFEAQAQEIALLKYQGGGDWYANPTSLPNLIDFCNKNINTSIAAKPETVEPGKHRYFPVSFCTYDRSRKCIFQ